MSAARESIDRYWREHVAQATEKKSLFLAGLKETGTVLHAAELADISRNTAYQWRTVDPEFRAEWDSILEDVTDKVERSLFNQAVSEKNVVATIFYLKGNRRAKYGERVQVDIGAAQREIEERLGSILPHGSTKVLTSGDPLHSSSTKEIIASVLRDRPLVHRPDSED